MQKDMQMGRKRLYENVPCSVEGCSRHAKMRGWCEAHYARWRRHGDPLAGNTPVGDPIRFFKDVVRGYGGEECLIWPYARNSSGYGHLKVNGDQVLVHRLACEEKYGLPPSPTCEAAHSCGNGHLGCVNQNHLSWKTPAGNSADKRVHGTLLMGEKSPSAKLTERQVREIRALKGRMSKRRIANKFGVSDVLISMIHNRKVWRHLEPPRQMFKEISAS